MSFINLKGILQPLGALKQLGKKPHTIQFPYETINASDNYRGLHFNDLDQCIGCGNCSTICQNDAIDMIPLDNIEGKEGDSGLRPRVDNGRCCWCALCIDVCPTGSLNLTKDYIFVSDSPDDFLWTPGVDNPEGENNLSYTSDTHTSLSMYDRVPMRELDGKERVKSFAEVVLGYSEEEARAEAQRCISCGLCTEVCPDHMHIPEYINAIANAKDDDALRIIYDNNPLPEMCGKVCTRRCEDVCAMQVRGDAVAIRWLKRYATETAPTVELIKEIVNPQIEEPNGFSVGIIGAGPAGLTAAYYLALKGYDVTIYESNAHAGGMVMYGIPKYRFPLDSINKQIEYMESIGVKINYNTKVGKDISFDEIYSTNDAVFLGIGLQKPWNIGIKNEDIPGVIPAIDYLKIINSGEKFNVGKKVAVIGGGNVAIDGARVAARFDTEVTILYRRRVEDMPADWEEIEGAEHEGVKIIPQAIPTRIIKNKDGKVKGIEYVKAKMVTQEGGRPRPVAIEGSETIYECDTVIGAIGQQADFEWLPEKYKEDIIIERGKVQVNDLRQTGDPKIFAGGDSVKYGNSDAISAIADGFNAVKGIDKLLLGVKQ